MKKNLTFLEQAELLEKRGIKINNLESVSNKLKTISYYKLKEFAEPFNIRKYGQEPLYENVTFEEILQRYYQDKNLRIYLMHAIEKIEISFKTIIAYNLGKLGAYGYLDEGSWINRSDFLRNKAAFKNIFEKHSRENFYEVEIDYKKGLYSRKVPSVWIFINSLTFGEVVKIYEIMSLKREREVAKYYKLNKDNLDSFIRAVKLIRNLCAHNNNIIDFRFKTFPVILNEWKPYIKDFSKNDKDGSHLAVVVLVIKYFVDIINPNYKYRRIKKTIIRIINGSDERARMLGFKNKEIINEIIKI